MAGKSCHFYFLLGVSVSLIFLYQMSQGWIGFNSFRFFVDKI